MKDDLNIIRAHRGLVKKIGAIIIGLFSLYVIVGFWVAPPLLKTELEQQLTDMLGRKVTIDTIKLNPLVLSATTTDLMVHEMDGSPFAGFKELYVNVQASSLFRWAGTVREIRLSSPFGTLMLLPEGKMNIDDLITRFSHSTPPSGQKKGLPRAIVDRLVVTDGKFTFANLAASTPVYDVITPISFTLENLSTLKGREGEFHFAGGGPIGGTFDLKGNLELNPLRIEGRFATKGVELIRHWEHIKDMVSFEIISGTIGVSGDFYAAIDQSGLSAWLENGTVQLDKFQLTEKGRKTVLINLPMVSTKGIRADLAAHEIIIDQVHLADAQVDSWLTADGIFALQHLLLPDLEKLMEKQTASEPGSESPLKESWQLTLKKIEVADAGLAFEDRTLTHPAKLSVDGIHAVVENLSTLKDTRATVGATMQINRAGQIKAEGTAGIDPLQADMKVVAAKIALKPFQPYVDDAVNARITSGSTSSTGRIRYRGKDAQPQFRVEGEFSVDKLEIQDNVQVDDFISLGQLKAGGIELELLPNRLKVMDVHVNHPHARVTIDNAGVINVVRAFAPADNKKESGKEDLLQRLVNFLIMEFKGPMPIRVDRVRLDGFTVDFMDASVSPPFSTHVDIPGGMVSGLSSESATRADFKISGSIDPKAAIQASGQVNPMNAFRYSKVDVSLSDFALESISPYSGKYIGYRIAKGALRTELKYKIDDDQVHGDNVITIDGLELGDAVDSPDALNLPIKLGVTLLKDKNGRIALQVPVVGNVRDPQFDFAKTINSALTGTIEKAGSEPFTAIREIDGFTGEELRVVAFEFGSFDLTETQTKKLNALASYLKDKNALILGVSGTADRQMDAAAIMGEVPEKNPSASGSQDAEKMQPEAVTAAAVDNGRLEALAQQRTDKVMAYLVEQSGVDAARIEVKPVQVKSEPDGEKGSVEFSLSVK